MAKSSLGLDDDDDDPEINWSDSHNQFIKKMIEFRETDIISENDWDFTPFYTQEEDPFKDEKLAKFRPATSPDSYNPDEQVSRN